MEAHLFAELYRCRDDLPSWPDATKPASVTAAKLPHTIAPGTCADPDWNVF